MKRLIVLCLVLLLAGCGGPSPEQPLDADSDSLHTVTVMTVNGTFVHEPALLGFRERGYRIVEVDGGVFWYPYENVVRVQQEGVSR